MVIFGGDAQVRGGVFCVHLAQGLETCYYRVVSFSGTIFFHPFSHARADSCRTLYLRSTNNISATKSGTGSLLHCFLTVEVGRATYREREKLSFYKRAATMLSHPWKNSPQQGRRSCEALWYKTNSSEAHN